LLAWFQSAQSLPSDLKAPVWIKKLLLAIGGPIGLGFGLFAVSFIDSSFLSLPGLNEFLVVSLSLGGGAAWAFYVATMATLGSTAGCLVIYSIGRKGGEFLLRKRIEEGKLKRLHDWFKKNEFVAVLVSSFLPPPMPFKLFVLAAGGFRVRFKYFLAAILLGRSLRFYALAFVGAYFGHGVIDYVKAHPVQVSVIAVTLVLAVYALFRLAVRRADPSASAE